MNIPSTTPTTPAGWYPNPDDPASVRYWDGLAWTSQTAPATAPAPGLVPPPPPVAAPRAHSADAPPTANAGRKKWLIGGAIAVGILLVSSIAGAMGGNDDPAATDPLPPASAEADETAPEPSEPAESDAEAAPADADPVAFRAQSNSHLDDMLKDLDDLVTTVEEDGFWRLLSNYGELSFNWGQLDALDIPPSVASTWPAALTELDGSLDELGTAIETQDGPTILAAVDVVRTHVEATREVANTAN